MKKTNIILNYIAVLAIFLFSGAGTLMNAAIQSMMDAWPGLSATTIRMVVSLPPLVSLPVMLVIGAIVGKRFSYRACAVTGTFLILAGGVLPYFFPGNWTLVLMFRTLLGIGVGFIGMRNSLVIKSIPAEKQAAYIGYGTVLMNVGNVLANPIVGYLTRFGWNYAFLFDGLAIVPLVIIILFLKEPEEAVTEEAVSASDAKEKIGWRPLCYIVLQFLTTAVLYPMLAGMSTFMADKNLGNAAIVGTVLSSYTFAGAMVNLVINPVMKVLKRYTISAMCMLVVIGQSLVLFVPSIPTIFAGTVLAGIGFNALITFFQVHNGQAAPKSRVAFTSTVILAMLQFGIFASNYYINICHSIFQRSTDIESAFLGTVICYIVMAVFAAVARVVPEN